MRSKQVIAILQAELRSKDAQIESLREDNKRLLGAALASSAERAVSVVTRSDTAVRERKPQPVMIDS
jgi:hypothetical protein